MFFLQLQLELKTSELAEFGKLLTEWQSNQLSTKAFVKQIARLYGSSRRNLLDGTEIHDEMTDIIRLICRFTRFSPSRRTKMVSGIFRQFENNIIVILK